MQIELSKLKQAKVDFRLRNIDSLSLSLLGVKTEANAILATALEIGLNDLYEQLSCIRDSMATIPLKNNFS